MFRVYPFILQQKHNVFSSGIVGTKGVFKIPFKDFRTYNEVHVLYIRVVTTQVCPAAYPYCYHYLGNPQDHVKGHSTAISIFLFRYNFWKVYLNGISSLWMSTRQMPLKRICNFILNLFWPLTCSLNTKMHFISTTLLLLKQVRSQSRTRTEIFLFEANSVVYCIFWIILPSKLSYVCSF